MCPLHLKYYIMLTPEEMKDRTLRLVKEGNFIEGIYNYCDRWCEKCQFTTRCLNYESDKDAPPPDSSDLFEYLDNVFKSTMLMLDELMEEMGVDPAEIEKMELPEGPDPREHPLYKKSYNLSMSMHKWLEENNPGELLTGIPYPGNNDNKTHDAIEIIYFYNFFISAKIFRALSGINDFDTGEIQTDSNGSAKIVLIAVDRLIPAWSILMETKKDQEDAILQFLISLADIRKQTATIFPNARKFIRPGFDE